VISWIQKHFPSNALSEIYADLNDYKNAFKFQKLYQQWSDSINTVDIKYKIVEANLQHEFDVQTKIENERQEKINPGQ
jgi:hypothetical protein